FFIDITYTKTIIPRPIKMPGIIPPRNNAPTDAFAIPANITIGILGGIITPIVDDAAVTATEVFVSYPLSFILGIKILPTPAVSACEAPETPANIIETKIFERSEEHTSELQSRFDLVCRLLL